jgi:Ribosomal protein L1
MRKHGKKYKNAAKKVVAREPIHIKDALAKIKELAFAKFDESVDADVVLGIDATKGEQVVRGSVVLPHGRGRTIKVLVFAKGDKAEEAKNAGADYVGDQDLIDKIEGGWMDFSYAIATPDMMGGCW